MKLTLIFSTLAVAYAIADSGIMNSRIIGGHDWHQTIFAGHVVSSLRNQKHFCASITFNERFIVTTSTCVSGKRVNEISVFVGATSFSDSVERFQIDAIIMKTPFGSRSIKDNIAFLHTNQNIYPIHNSSGTWRSRRTLCYDLWMGWTKSGLWFSLKFLNNLIYHLFSWFYQILVYFYNYFAMTFA